MDEDGVGRTTDGLNGRGIESIPTRHCLYRRNSQLKYVTFDYTSERTCE